MRNHLNLLTVLVFLGAIECFFLVPAFAMQVSDDQGRIISLEKPAQRIIPLYGAFAEMLFAIGAGEQVIARTQADAFPEGVKMLPSVGTHMKPNVEMIIGLKPDLVIQSASRREAIPGMDSLEQAGIPVAVFAPRSFSGIFATISRLGQLTGRQQQAESLLEDLRKRLARVQFHLGLNQAESVLAGTDKRILARCTIKRRRTVFFEVRAEPLTAAGQGSMVQDILNLAGANNVVKSEKSLLIYNLESLLLSDPDFYLVQTGPMNRNPVDPRKRVHFEKLRAMRDGNVLYVDEFLYSRPGPRCVDAVEQLAATLYPECFRAGTQ